MSLRRAGLARETARSPGFTLIELLFVLALTAIVSAMAIPLTTAGLDQSRARIAARYLAAQMALARAQAVRRAASVAIRFGDDASAFDMRMFVDGNANGIRTKDINAGVDEAVGVPERLGDRFPGVRIGVGDAPALAGNPIRFGASGLLTFTASGTATPGSVYVTGRAGSVYVVRVTGATGRTRVLRYLALRDEWVDP